MRTKWCAAAMALAFVLALAPFTARAQSGTMQAEDVKQIMEETKGNWIAFRIVGEEEAILFSHLLIYKCGLKEIRYSINSGDLNERFPLPACDPGMPFAASPGDRTFLTNRIGAVRKISVQLVFTDGSESPVNTYEPCPFETAVPCAQLTSIKRRSGLGDGLIALAPLAANIRG